MSHFQRKLGGLGQIYCRVEASSPQKTAWRYILYPSTLLVTVALLSPALSYLTIISPMNGFRTFVYSGGLAIIAMVVGIAAAFFGHLRIALRVILPNTLIFGAVAWMMAGSLNYPPINDITTDTKTPPEFKKAQLESANRGRNLTFPPEFTSQIEEAYPHVRSLQIDRPKRQVFRLLEALARKEKDWTLTDVDRAAGRIEGYEKTIFWHFTDDFVIRVQSHSPTVTQIDMRSKSRDGRGDFGANAKRISEFFTSVKRTLAGG